MLYAVWHSSLWPPTTAHLGQCGATGQWVYSRVHVWCGVHPVSQPHQDMFQCWHWVVRGGTSLWWAFKILQRFYKIDKFTHHFNSFTLQMKIFIEIKIIYAIYFYFTVECGVPTTPAHGSVTLTSDGSTTVVIVTCDLGYTVGGSVSSAECQTDGSYTIVLPACGMH